MAGIIPIKKPEFAVCKECVYFLNTAEVGTPQEGIWYNHFCKATPLPVKRDPYDGVEKCYGVNDLGTQYFVTDQEFEYIRKVNKDGNCPKFHRR